MTLSMAEAELSALLSCIQDMMYVYHIVTSLKLKIELPIIFELENSGAEDLACNWSVGRCTRHATEQMISCMRRTRGLLFFNIFQAKKTRLTLKKIY